MNEDHVSRLGTAAAGGAAFDALRPAPGMARARFLDYVRDPATHRPPVSPFLPKPDVLEDALRHLGLTPTGDAVSDEIALAGAVDYEPMFMVGCTQFIFAIKWDSCFAGGILVTGRQLFAPVDFVMPVRRICF